MSQLGDDRRRFSKMQVLLGMYAQFLGFEYAWGRLQACEDCPNVHPRSTHKVGLGVDMHLYIDGEYVSDGAYHAPLHDFWDLLGGAERIEGDMNHYSIEYQGVR